MEDYATTKMLALFSNGYRKTNGAYAETVSTYDEKDTSALSKFNSEFATLSDKQRTTFLKDFLLKMSQSIISSRVVASRLPALDGGSTKEGYVERIKVRSKKHEDYDPDGKTHAVPRTDEIMKNYQFNVDYNVYTDTERDEDFAGKMDAAGAVSLINAKIQEHLYNELERDRNEKKEALLTHNVYLMEDIEADEPTTADAIGALVRKVENVGVDLSLEERDSSYLPFYTECDGYQPSEMAGYISPDYKGYYDEVYARIQHPEYVKITSDWSIVKAFRGTNTIAVLASKDFAKLFNLKDKITSETNAEGDFMTQYRHVKDTAIVNVFEPAIRFCKVGTGKVHIVIDDKSAEDIKAKDLLKLSIPTLKTSTLGDSYNGQNVYRAFKNDVVTIHVAKASGYNYALGGDAAGKELDAEGNADITINTGKIEITVTAD